MEAPYLVVGAGLTGAVIARVLKDAGHSVVVLDRRHEWAGNVADGFHSSGIHIHKYGPHLFRTVSDEIWAFVNRFASFHDYRHQIRSLVDGHYEQWPVAASYIRKLCGDNWSPEAPSQKPRNFEEAALSLMPRRIYEAFVKGYNEKQWGVSAQALSADLCKRFDVRHDDNPYLMPSHKYQGIPTDGYSRMVGRMLKGIPVHLNVDYLRQRESFIATKCLIFTGPIDEYFNFALGRLMYRGQRRTHVHVNDNWVLPCAQVNNPGHGAHIRTIEWKHMMLPTAAAAANGSILTHEVPYSPDKPEDYEYPFPDEHNKHLYLAYRKLAQFQQGTLICGRLGEYRYYDMDHAIGRALTLAKRLLSNAPLRQIDEAAR